MSLIDEFLTQEQRWQATKNLGLARQFFREYLDEPETFSGFANGSAIVLLPPDDHGDAHLTEVNLQMAHQLAMQGRHVIAYGVGMRPPGQPIHLTKVGFNQKPKRVLYNPESDTLTITFDEPAAVVGVTAMHPLVDATFDPETQRMTQMLVRHFTSNVAPRAPQLLDAILQSSAEFIGISRDTLLTLRSNTTTGDDVIWSSLGQNTG